jgi:hypothetical protein
MWIKMERQFISPEVTVKGFNKCCISNTVDETDDKLWNGSKEDGNITRECEEDEGTECEDGDSDTNWQRKIGSNRHCVLSV